MDVNINVKRKFKINGKEYESLEDVPAEMREAVQKALDAREIPGFPSKAAVVRTKIVFNGAEYESLEAMPQDVRRLYEQVIKAAEIKTGRDGFDLRKIIPRTNVESRAKGPVLSDLRPEPTTTGRPAFLWVLLAFVLLVGLIYLFKVLF
jgi:hypothetical protein